jgi:predicted nicotinamide N-methyase
MSGDRLNGDRLNGDRLNDDGVAHEELTYDELQQLATARFAWHWDDVQIAGQRRPLAVASDPDAMLIEACQRQDAGELNVIDPFWATTWRAAAGLDRYFDRLDLSGLRVLELGCGTGHAGLAAAHRRAQCVLTDGVEEPLLLVRMSSWNVRDRCRVRRLRFAMDRLDEAPFPLIIGSDVTYLRSIWPDLDRALKDHLAENGEVLLSDPYRSICDEFRDWVGDHGWQYEEHRVELADDLKHPIRVMRLTRL